MKKLKTAVVVLFLLVLVLGGAWYLEHQQLVRVQKDLANYRQTYLYRNGVNKEYPEGYRLLSVDGGKTWYATERREDGVVVILGEADKVYPGLVRHLAAWDALMEYVRQHGPLTFSGPDAERQRQLLERAGFTVESK
jgi:hypothetical protein